MKLGFASVITLSVLVQGTATSDFMRKATRSLQTCSLGEGQVNCTATNNPNPCFEQVVNDCQAGVFCRDAGACSFSSMSNSKVVCEIERSCYLTVFHGSDVTCYNSSVSCFAASFYASAVECQTGACPGASGFDACSCCRGPNCPENVASCSDDVEKFCAQDYLGRTCKDWGNPACAPVNVNSPPLHAASSCFPFQEEGHICERLRGGCNIETNISDCSVVCVDSCGGATISDSDVVCMTESCMYTAFHRSNVTCFPNINVCMSTLFYASAVEGQVGSRADAAVFDDCSCCTGPVCPDNVARCSTDAEKEAFCEKEVTCNILENPVCRQRPPTPSPSPPPSPEPTPMVGAIIGGVLAGIIIVLPGLVYCAKLRRTAASTETAKEAATRQLRP